MGKISKVLVCGHAGVGKTAAIEHLIYGTHSVGSVSTNDTTDIYTDRCVLCHCYSVFINLKLDRTIQKLPVIQIFLIQIEVKTQRKKSVVRI